MPDQELEQPEFSDCQLYDVLKQVGRDAQQAAFRVGQPVVVLKHQALVQIFPDGREVILRPLEQPAHVAGSAN